MTVSEAMAEQREQRLVRLRRRMGRALRKGETAEYERLTAEYAREKSAHVLLVHEEHVAARRAARAAVRAQEAAVGPARWRLPAGFGRSPLARERDRLGPAPVAPQIPAGGLRPWRRGGSPMGEQIWRPGR